MYSELLQMMRLTLKLAFELLELKQTVMIGFPQLQWKIQLQCWMMW